MLDNKLVYGFTIAVLFILVAANLIGTNALATEGFLVSDIETKTLSLEKENHEYQVKIEETSKLNSLEKLAQNNGYVRTSNIVFMPTPPTTALLQ